MSRVRMAEDITGDRVSAMMPEMRTEPASEKANSRNMTPVMPASSPIGA